MDILYITVCYYNIAIEQIHLLLPSSFDVSGSVTLYSIFPQVLTGPPTIPVAPTSSQNLASATLMGLSTFVRFDYRTMGKV